MGVSERELLALTNHPHEDRTLIIRVICQVGICFSLLLATMASSSASDKSVRWDFETAKIPGATAEGEVRFEKPGPRPPEFPDFAATNRAVELGGNGSRIIVADPGANSPYDFAQGDELTLEAWIRVDAIGAGQHHYVIGKGRTGQPGFRADNQNWALRIHRANDLICINFLFASERTAGDAGDSHWHRWTSKEGFHEGTGWHHVAVTYEFGNPDSIRGWIDGKATSGQWDMGGATERAPIVDDDAVWVGSSMGGAGSSSFQGGLDNVAIHRHIVSEKELAARFNRTGGARVVRAADEVMPDMGEVPADAVVVTIGEKMPNRDRWLNEGEKWPEDVIRWTTPDFLLSRIPLRYDDFGHRTEWAGPVLVRMAGDVELTPGTHRMLLRARAVSRLWVDGKVVARTGPVTVTPHNGEEEIAPVEEPPLPGLRVVGYHQQETSAEVAIDKPGKHRVVLEMIVGGSGRRAETGEICIALATPDGKSFNLLSPNGTVAPLPLTDEAVEAAIAKIETAMRELDDETRRSTAAKETPYWEKRHAAARTWGEQHPAPPVPAASRDGKPLQHPVDAFIAAKIDAAVANSAQSDRETALKFHGKVWPILRDHCVRCHGDKENGGLRLDSRTGILAAGESGLTAVTPGDVDDSELIRRVRSEDEVDQMPPGVGKLTEEQIALLEEWINSGAEWPAPLVEKEAVAFAPRIDDAAFLRRAYLDIVGVPPTAAEAMGFHSDTSPDKRERLIDELLADPRYADNWMGYWQDMLAENPTILNQSLNSTGPFRWFLHEALRDNKPLDRMVTELIMLRGNPHAGGSAGFALAAENDSPFATKGQIVSSAFLGVETQCARCHDSPYHSSLQRDLFSLAAMFSRASVKVPEASTVPADFLAQKGKAALIKVTLKADEEITPDWPFADVTGVAQDDVTSLMRDPKDSREKLAVLITVPQNERFARVMVNRIWQRLMGAGIVEPVHDWEGQAASHPELLSWLAHELVTHDYDMKHVMRLLMTSDTWQRQAVGNNLAEAAEVRFFNAPDQRRLTAEQIVDSLHASVGASMTGEELTFVHDGRRENSNRLTLGVAERGWMLASLANERDRPSLALPRARAIADVLEAFGWNGSRQQPGTQRDLEPNILQPGILANGVLSQNLTRASNQSELAQLAVDARSPEHLIDQIFLRFFSRPATEQERQAFLPALSEGFDTRLVPADQVKQPEAPPPLRLVTWFNHLMPEANSIQVEVERRTRLGPPADPRLEEQWRSVYEDFVWSLVNTREFVWMP